MWAPPSTGPVEQDDAAQKQGDGDDQRHAAGPNASTPNGTGQPHGLVSKEDGDEEDQDPHNSVRFLHYEEQPLLTMTLRREMIWQWTSAVNPSAPGLHKPTDSVNKPCSGGMFKDPSFHFRIMENIRVS